MGHDAVQVVHDSADRAVRLASGPLVLAVSGGLDSMAMMHAMADVAGVRIAAVATFDHGTGSFASSAVEQVRTSAERLGLPVVTGKAGDLTLTEGREAAWRTARHTFLREVAARLGARVVTAHTEDDQVETVFMRILRGSGARGLAGLYAESPFVRPLLSVRRATLEGYVHDRAIVWVDDPTNASREFFRNRVRHDLLPALRRQDSAVDTWVLDTARRAAALRRDIEAFVSSEIRPELDRTGYLSVPRKELRGYERDSLQVLWNAIAGRAGLALDARGTRRLAEFTMSAPGGGRMPLAGGWCLEATRSAYILGRSTASTVPPAVLPLQGSLDWGRFRFHASAANVRSSAATVWSAEFPVADGEMVVREWTDGDRLAPAGGRPRRRVKRFLSDVGLQGGERAGWPVVVAGDDVVWIPGVRRSDAATDRSGRPVRHYLCERIDR